MEQEQTHEQPTLLIASAPSRRLTAIDESVAGIRTLEWAAAENPACAHICEAAIRVKKVRLLANLASAFVRNELSIEYRPTLEVNV